MVPGLIAIAVAAVALLAGSGLGGRSEAATPASPNILVVLTDDQPVGMTRRMPFLDGAQGFTRFSAAYDNNPLCCPARATLLTGLYSHHHGVGTNLVAERFDDSSTLATWLDDAGYETGLFGKYMNGYPWDRGRGFVPPGWDEWAAFEEDAAYYDYTLLTGDGAERHAGGRRDYSTDVLADHVVRFMNDSEDPFFALFTPYGPHSPRTPAPRHEGAYADKRVKLPRNFDRPSKGSPPYWRKLPTARANRARRDIRGQWETLLSVDDALKRFTEALRSTGELDDTVIVFLSDNGYSLGSHRNLQKDCPYEECIKVPLLVRWPGEQTVPVVPGLVSNIDIAPTLAQIAGASAPVGMDGTSLVPLLSGERDSLERPVLLRHVHYPRTAPSFWGIRTERWTYASYADGSKELYDMRADPHQLRNLHGKARFRQTERELRARVGELRGR